MSISTTPLNGASCRVRPQGSCVPALIALFTSVLRRPRRAGQSLPRAASGWEHPNPWRRAGPCSELPGRSLSWGQAQWRSATLGTRLSISSRFLRRRIASSNPKRRGSVVFSTLLARVSTLDWGPWRTRTTPRPRRTCNCGLCPARDALPALVEYFKASVARMPANWVETNYPSKRTQVIRDMPGWETFMSLPARLDENHVVDDVIGINGLDPSLVGSMLGAYSS